ncbi:ANR family transcriptional regulator [Citrobacter meridianamericanus]|uniref:ANR family transcriptional regulator n=1 Tax=Citrobacter meridianamericanus TaxID=2894201 RepID=A0ABT1BHB0_9ENTR|nr:ANR family transcriptional regulator [Citrobacter meridianamericanus]MCO5784604.1 ANR family transcriptional regulator [Citrobacter meridianamericanus]
MGELTAGSYYINMASAAAVAERGHEWQRAARLWEQAEAVARHALNRDWSSTRMQFCLRQWRYTDAAQKMSGVRG